MVAVRMAAEQDVDIAEMESQLFHAGFDQGHGPLVTAVYQDVSLWRGDQERRKLRRADVVDVTDDAMRRKGRIIVLGQQRHRGQAQQQESSPYHFRASSMRSESMSTKRS